jgi:uncharacterized Tic20 family protein
MKVEDIFGYGKKDDNNFLILFHLSVLSFFLIPFGNILIPGILWLTKRDKINGLNEKGVDLLNFQIIWTILVFVFFAASMLVYTDWHTGHGRVYEPAIYVVILLTLINIIYAIATAVLISKRSQKKYFYPLIKIIKH